MDSDTERAPPEDTASSVDVLPDPPVLVRQGLQLGPAQWLKLVARLDWEAEAIRSLYNKLHTIQTLLEGIVTQDDQLSSGIAAEQADIQSIIQSLQPLQMAVSDNTAALAALRQAVGNTPSPAVAAAISQLADAHTSLQAIGSALQNATSQISSDDTGPAAPPAPAPNPGA